tara:strand:- start:302 stop:529 length:228 start_codon:yes stop_codon:yes gene_type:complete
MSEEHDYAADVPASIDSYNIVVDINSKVKDNLTDEDKATRERNERHLALKMQHSEFVDALTAEQKANIEALNISL